MRTIPSLAIAVAVLCRTVASDPLSPAKPTSSLRGANSAGEADRANGRALQQYVDQSCYQKYYTDEGTVVQEVACASQPCSGIENVCGGNTEAAAQGSAELSSINSWFVWFANDGDGCEWRFMVCS
jgi:hypothetical protein